MANCAEQYQDEIKLIFDQFIKLMRTSAARVDIGFTETAKGIAKLQLNCGSVDHVLDLFLPLSSPFRILVT